MEQEARYLLQRISQTRHCRLCGKVNLICRDFMSTVFRIVGPCSAWQQQLQKLLKTSELTPTKTTSLASASWGPRYWSIYQPVHGGHRFLLSFSRHLLTSDDATLEFLGPCLQGLHHVSGLVSSDKESATHILSRKGGGNLLSIIVGSVQELLNARPGTYKLMLRNGKGFIRLALMHGADLVLIFSFGENDMYEQVENSRDSWLRWFQDHLNKSTRGSIPLFYGRGVFQYSSSLVPYCRPITTVVGKPIEVQKTPHPSQEEVDRFHQRYMKELENLFEAHKLKGLVFVPRDQHSEIC